MMLETSGIKKKQKKVSKSKRQLKIERDHVPVRNCLTICDLTVTAQQSLYSFLSFLTVCLDSTILVSLLLLVNISPSVLPSLNILYLNFPPHFKIYSVCLSSHLMYATSTNSMLNCCFRFYSSYNCLSMSSI